MVTWRTLGKLFAGLLFTQSLWGYSPAVAQAVPAFVLQIGHSGRVTSVAFSPDGHTLASGSWDNTVKVWEVGTGKLLRTLEGHSSEVLSLAFSPDGLTLAAGGIDGSLRWWRLPGGDLLAISYAFSEDYLTFTPEGLYVASEDGEELAAWRVGGEVYGFEQYAERCHRPDLIAQRLAGDAIASPRRCASGDRSASEASLGRALPGDEQ